MEQIKYLGNYIQGKFVLPSDTSYEIKKSPGDLDDQVISFPTSFTSQPLVSTSAKEAHKNWSRLSLEERINFLSPLKDIFQKKKKELSQTISRETGKPLYESEIEVQAMINKIDITCDHSIKRIATEEIELLGSKGRVKFKSRGVFLVISPFNFPMHLAFGQLLPALLSGNTVIWKGSEKTPACTQILTECFHLLKLPKGVFQMVQGDRHISEELVKDPLVDGVLFVGSFLTGSKIKEALVKDHHKILALEMGGYNSTLIWDYKNKERAISETIKSCFQTAGQRCSSTSQILVNKKISKEFIESFLKASKEVTINHWQKNPFMGSLIDEHSLKRFNSFQKEAEDFGLEILKKGEVLNNLKGYYASPGVYKISKEKSLLFGHEERFAPQVIICEVEDLEEASQMINHSGYGLVLSIFTEDKKIKEEMYQRAKVGLLNFNRASCGASSLLPFGGYGKSGNDRPAASFMIDSCVSVVAELE